jgi:hypothetical protein
VSDPLNLVWKLAQDVGARVYGNHPGTEPEAFAALQEVQLPFVPLLRERGPARDSGRLP